MARPKQFEPARVLEKAQDVFWQQGYAATSVQDLVDAMQVGRGSLYETFEDKYSLYLKALEHYKVVGYAGLCQALEAPGSLQDVIGAWLRATPANADAPCPHGCFLVNAVVERAAHDETVAEQGRAALQATENTLYNRLQRAQANGELSAERDPRQLAQVLVAVMVGLRVLAKTNPSATQIDNIVAGAVAMLA